YLYGSMLLGALIGAIFQTPLTTIVGGFSGAFIVWIWLQGQRERYQEKIEAQTEQMIQTVAIVYGLNRNLAQALEEAYRDADEPLKGMLGRFVQEYRAGRPLKECLEEMEKQLPVACFKMFSSVLQVVERSGGDAAETMKNVADIVNKNRFLRQELKSELASVKQENRINVALGLLILIIFRFMITDQYMMLANNILGQILIGGMLTYMVYSIYQVNKLTRI
ncbi:MAG TPA: type II secretion system F family protein, partial [Oculatellaceae cyanobacterium]